jgi:hypothetical protein
VVLLGVLLVRLHHFLEVRELTVEKLHGSKLAGVSTLFLSLSTDCVDELPDSLVVVHRRLTLAAESGVCNIKALLIFASARSFEVYIHLEAQVPIRLSNRVWIY